jgi:hypothetical protein
VAKNGQRRQRRPRIELSTPAASPQEAAAIAAAIERFIAETAPAPTPAAGATSRWQRAALLDGVGTKAELDPPWGNRPS